MADKPQGKGPKLPKMQTKLNPRLLVLLGIAVIGAVAYFGGTFFMQQQQAPTTPIPSPKPVTTAPQPASPAAMPKPAAKPTAQPPAAKPAAPAATAKAGDFSLQVHTLFNKANADKAVADLKAKGLDAFMMEKTISTEKAALQLTGYKTLEEAEADASVLRNSKVIANPAAQKVADDQYVVSAGTYSGPEGAAMSGKLKMLGYSVSSQAIGGKTSAQAYMVRVGHYPSKEAALASAEMTKLKEMKLSPMVVDP